MTREELLAEVRRAWTEGSEPASAIGKRLGVTKNTILGIAYRAGWERPLDLIPKHETSGIRKPVETMEDRFRRYEARLDAVLAATLGVGRMTEAEAKERRDAWDKRQRDHTTPSRGAM